MIARRLLVPATALVCLASRGLAAQERANVGLPASGAIGVFAGGGRMERPGAVGEAGVLLDLGWLRGKAVRLQAEASLLRARLHEVVSVLGADSTFRGHYYDLSVAATVVLLAGDPAARAAPYLTAGIGVHALSSSLGGPLTQRYNANRFGSLVGAGLRIRPDPGGRMGAYLELRHVVADEVDRTLLRVGGLLFLGDMALGARAPQAR